MFGRWLRWRLKKVMKPLPVEYARQKKSQYAKMYFFCAWNVVGLTIYAYIKNNFPMTEEEKKDQSRWLIRLFQLENVSLYRMSGLSVEKVDYVEEPGELIVDGEVVYKKNRFNPKIFTKLD